MSISWISSSNTGTCSSSHSGRHTGSHGDHVGLPFGGDVELVDVGLQPVGGFDVGDRFVGGVGDHAFAEAVGGFGDLALPPGERRFAFVLDRFERPTPTSSVNCRQYSSLPSGLRIISPLGPTGSNSSSSFSPGWISGRGQRVREEVAFEARVGRRDPHLRRAQFRLRSRSVPVLRAFRRSLCSSSSCGPSCAIVNESSSEGPSLRCTTTCTSSPSVKGELRNEAGAGGAEVGLHAAEVGAADRAGGADRFDVRGGRPEDADLGRGRGVRRSRLRGDRDRGRGSPREPRRRSRGRRRRSARRCARGETSRPPARRYQRRIPAAAGVLPLPTSVPSPTACGVKKVTSPSTWR